MYARCCRPVAGNIVASSFIITLKVKFLRRYTVSIGKDLTDVSTDLDAFLWSVGNTLPIDTS